MEKYRANMKKMVKSVTFAWVMVFALASSVTAHAAGIGLAEAADKDLIQTQNVEQDGEFMNVTGWSEEFNVETSDVVDIVYVNDGIMTLGQGTIDWNIPAGTRYVTSAIYFAAGSKVQITCTAKPNTCTYWFGIMNENSDCTVVEGAGMGAHEFTVPTTGYYRIMVENRSIQSIRVTGSYAY